MCPARCESAFDQGPLAALVDSDSAEIALHCLSMAAAGSRPAELSSFRRLVQELNHLQAEKLPFAGDRSSRGSRISHAH